MNSEALQCPCVESRSVLLRSKKRLSTLFIRFSKGLEGQGQKEWSKTHGSNENENNLNVERRQAIRFIKFNIKNEQ